MRLWRPVELEQFGHLAQQLALRGRFGEVAVERLLRIAAGLLEQTPLLAALGAAQIDLATRALAERVREQHLLLQIAIDQHDARRGHLLVELREEALQHLLLGHVGGVRGKEAAMTPILATTDEEGLDAGRRALGGDRPDIGVGHALGIDRLAALDEGERAQPVAQDGGKLEVHSFGRRRHLVGEFFLHLRRFAGEERLRILDQLGIIFPGDTIDARRRAALDLVEQAGPRAVLEEAVGTAAQQEQLLERVERPRHRSGAGERPVILPLGAPRAAMLLHAREGMILAQQDEGERLIVAQQDVVGRPEALDQLRLEQQRLGLGIGGDDRHRSRLRDHAQQPLGQARDLRIVGHPVAQRARLADVEHVALGILHPIDAGANRAMSSRRCGSPPPPLRDRVDPIRAR